MCFSPLVMFSQSDDISKKQAYELFLKSSAKDSLEIEDRNFEKLFKTAKCIKKNWNIKLKDMPIFNPNKKEFLKPMDYHISEVFGVTDIGYPNYDDFGKKKITCGVVRTFSIK